MPKIYLLKKHIQQQQELERARTAKLDYRVVSGELNIKDYEEDRYPTHYIQKTPPKSEKTNASSSQPTSSPDSLYYSSVSSSSSGSSPDRYLETSSSDTSLSSYSRDRSHSKTPESWKPHLRDSSSPNDQPISLVVESKGKIIV